jgi:hypothetical protein
VPLELFAVPGTINGVRIDSVKVEAEKLVLKINHCFEAVFALDFDLPQEFFVNDE